MYMYRMLALLFFGLQLICATVSHAHIGENATKMPIKLTRIDENRIQKKQKEVAQKLARRTVIRRTMLLGAAGITAYHVWVIGRWLLGKDQATGHYAPHGKPDQSWGEWVKDTDTWCSFGRFGANIAGTILAERVLGTAIHSAMEPETVAWYVGTHAPCVSTVYGIQLFAQTLEEGRQGSAYELRCRKALMDSGNTFVQQVESIIAYMRYKMKKFTPQEHDEADEAVMHLKRHTDNFCAHVEEYCADDYAGLIDCVVRTKRFIDRELWRFSRIEESEWFEMDDLYRALEEERIARMMRSMHSYTHMQKAR